MTDRLLVVTIRRLEHAPSDLPAYHSEGAAGMDLQLAGDAVDLEPGECRLLPTGFAIAIPMGFEGQIRLRSGFALRNGLVIPNAPGTIDSDYRGEIKVMILNLGRKAVRIESGERFAQLVICPVTRCVWQESDVLPESGRGSGGFGSTDK